MKIYRPADAVPGKQPQENASVKKTKNTPLSTFDDPDECRFGLMRLYAIYAHEFTRAYRPGKTPAIFEDEPIGPSLVELCERERQRIATKK
jgi:hypothetical protein